MRDTAAATADTLSHCHPMECNKIFKWLSDWSSYSIENFPGSHWLTYNRVYRLSIVKRRRTCRHRSGIQFVRTDSSTESFFRGGGLPSFSKIQLLALAGHFQYLVTYNNDTSMLASLTLIRSNATRRTAASAWQRSYTSTASVGFPVDLEHFASGWNIDDIGDFTRKGQYAVQTFNKISPQGLARFPPDLYTVAPKEASATPAHAILLRSHELQESDVDVSVRAIARCGAGTNNVPVARMTELGIPVFNTPGANANAVKELILCGMLLGSRRIVDGINHMKQLGEQGLAKERVEKDKAMFGGREIKDKVLAVIGLGHIGAATARDATALGMKVQVRHTRF